MLKCVSGENNFILFSKRLSLLYTKQKAEIFRFIQFYTETWKGIFLKIKWLEKSYFYLLYVIQFVFEA